MASLFERFVQSEHLYEGLPVEIANKGTRWCKGRKVPHRRLADLPPECRFEHQREREAVFVKTAVRYIVTDEIPSCDPDCKRQRRDRRIEIKPVAERYFHKYGMPKIEVGWEADACNGILYMEELEKLAAAKFADDQAAGQTQLKK